MGESFLEELGVSLATFKRDLEYMRDRFNASVIWDAHERGYQAKQCRRDAKPRGVASGGKRGDRQDGLLTADAR
jgi:hypothetical protein